jgi:DNA (cytosine-5)-methyltransferase 1
MEKIVKKIKNKPFRIRTVELFAGVGGFRIGLEGKQNKDSIYSYNWTPELAAKAPFQVIWSNQWEPATRIQHAALTYKEKFHDGMDPNPFFNADINEVVKLKKFPIPDHDLLVGGFPCQDYSVARTLSQANGIEGKKGVLWWAIHEILRKKRPNYVMLENVDRLLKSPVKQRGRDFGIILASLSDLGYIVEWRVINAADYGMPQRRRRVFILGYKKNSPIGRVAVKKDASELINKDGVVAKAFPLIQGKSDAPKKKVLKGSLVDLTQNFTFPFENTGIMIDKNIISARTFPDHKGSSVILKDILLSLKDVPRTYFLNPGDMDKWEYLKGAKRDIRTAKNGFSYSYNEGAISFPDPLNKPSRTIVTGEGGSTPSRFKHVVLQSGQYRRLTPIELERLCMFPDNHTQHRDISDVKRSFFIGNALVIGIIDKLGKSLYASHTNALK